MEIKTVMASLISKKKEARDIMTFRFDVKMDFKPGQFVMIKVGDITEAFSISSSPSENYIELSMKMTGSEYKKVLASARKGDKFEIKGPYGIFLMDESHDSVMIAGGIGITPFMSMIRHATAKKLPGKITLLYSNRTADEIVFEEELSHMEKKNKNFKVINTITRPEGHEWKGRVGRIDAGLIKSLGCQNSVFYVCGSTSMVEGITEMLSKSGIDEDKIKSEKFGGYV